MASNGIHKGERVSWHYRGAIGHGVVIGIAKQGRTSATTEYSIRESDHHPGEKPVLRHYGRALHRGTLTRKKSGRSNSRSPRR